MVKETSQKLKETSEDVPQAPGMPAKKRSALKRGTTAKPGAKKSSETVKFKTGNESNQSSVSPDPPPFRKSLTLASKLKRRNTIMPKLKDLNVAEIISKSTSTKKRRKSTDTAP